MRTTEGGTVEPACMFIVQCSARANKLYAERPLVLQEQTRSFVSSIFVKLVHQFC